MASFSVSAAGGFIAPNGQHWTMRGLNAGVQDALQGFANVFIDYPGLTAIRLNTGGNDSAADIDKVVQEYTARGVVVMIEDHSGNANNVAWYTQMATAYKDNPNVFLEMPNEPNPTNLSQIQIGLVNAIRAAGFTNPIALQPAGGYDFSNIAAVTAAVGKTNIFITPHIYYGGNDPNGAAQYVANDISTSLNLGLFPAIDEFGDAMDGWNRDPYGSQVISSVITANETGKAGAVFWAMDNGNHPNGADSAFLTASGTQLTPVGRDIQPWLSQTTTATGGVTNVPVTPPHITSPTGTTLGQPVLIMPGLGSFKDADGNVYTLSAAGDADKNGALMNGGTGTGAMELANGFIYGQDAASGRWYTWNQSTWTQSAAPPSATGTTTGGIATTGGGTTPPVLPPVTYPTSQPVGNPTTLPTTQTLPTAAPPSGTPEGYSIAGFDTSTGQYLVPVCQDYSGPVADLQYQYINITSDSLNITAATPNCFIHSGSGNDAIAVSSGTNVLDGGTGSNFLTGGSAADTFFVDDRAAPADIWSTVNSFQPGDAATIWGVTPQDFGLTWVDGQGAAEYTGLTLHATAPGRPIASLTLAGYSQADLNNGRLSVQFGTDPTSGSAYMYVHGNS